MRVTDDMQRDLDMESREISDTVRRLDTARGMIAGSWEGEPARIFLSKLEDVIEEIRQAEKTIERAAE